MKFPRHANQTKGEHIQALSPWPQETSTTSTWGLPWNACLHLHLHFLSSYSLSSAVDARAPICSMTSRDVITSGNPDGQSGFVPSTQSCMIRSAGRNDMDGGKIEGVWECTRRMRESIGRRVRWNTRPLKRKERAVA
jgi:hypothetical protein